jgi:hypothetical protein
VKKKRDEAMDFDKDPRVKELLSNGVNLNKSFPRPLLSQPP